MSSELEAPSAQTLNRGEVSLASLDEKIKLFEQYAFRVGANGTPLFFKMDGKPIHPNEIFSIKK
jgi:hypothetical protein